MFAVINLKFKQRGFSIDKFIQNVQIKWQTLQTLIRLLHKEQSDLGLHCLPRPVCTETKNHYGSSNEYPESLFRTEIRKISQFFYLKIVFFFGGYKYCSKSAEEIRCIFDDI